MTSNLHPLLVHFPIALLGLYAVLELIRYRKIAGQPYWFYVKAILVIVGALSTIPTILAGLLAKGQFQGDPISLKIISYHEPFAITSASIFGILAIGYLIVWIKSVRDAAGGPATAPPKELPAVFTIPLALLGLICITITGALGASIIYGPGLDPMVNFIYHVFIH
jgi:uncharacterized membrane protein